MFWYVYYNESVQKFHLATLSLYDVDIAIEKGNISGKTAKSGSGNVKITIKPKMSITQLYHFKNTGYKPFRGQGDGSVVPKEEML